jgi:hypothetical protein
MLRELEVWEMEEVVGGSCEITFGCTWGWPGGLSCGFGFSCSVQIEPRNHPGPTDSQISVERALYEGAVIRRGNDGGERFSTRTSPMTGSPGYM